MKRERKTVRYNAKWNEKKINIKAHHNAALTWTKKYTSSIFY